tara:strand:- start:412 stop:561 length:150 start_codon:yes stop_codon:yes gene_type:complete
MKKSQWVEPEIIDHGDASSLIKGIPGVPNKEFGPGDGIIVDDNPVSGPR